MVSVTRQTLLPTVVLAALLAVHLLIQLLLPFQHLLFPGNPEWTEEGHRGAWRMKLRDKDVLKDMAELIDQVVSENQSLRAKDSKRRAA